MECIIDKGKTLSWPTRCGDLLAAYSVDIAVKLFLDIDA
jgi:hypothetical protein